MTDQKSILDLLHATSEPKVPESIVDRARRQVARSDDPRRDWPVCSELVDRLPHDHGEATSQEAAHQKLDSGKMASDMLRVLRSAYQFFGRGWWTPKMLADRAAGGRPDRDAVLYMVRKRCSNAFALDYLEREQVRGEDGHKRFSPSGKPIYERQGNEYRNRLAPGGLFALQAVYPELARR